MNSTYSEWLLHHTVIVFAIIKELQGCYGDITADINTVICDQVNSNVQLSLTAPL